VVEMAENIEQILTNYEPTAAERRLLEVLINPENRNKSVTDICQLADISRTTYYEVFNKPEFVALKNKWGKTLVSSKTLAVIHAFQREAIQRGSFQHGKVLLEIDGVYTEKKEIEVNKKLPLSELIDDETESGGNKQG
jgi:hypothetical protein